MSSGPALSIVPWESPLERSPFVDIGAFATTRGQTFY